jgi:copper chaperone NosL
LKVLSFLFLCFFLLAASVGAENSIPVQKEKCPVCGMFVSLFADWNARIEFKDSTYSVFDGAKCMFKYYLELKKFNSSHEEGDIKAISVKDYNSALSIDARQAFYVVWSNVYGPMGHEPIPFQTSTAARKFLKEHKGKQILRFQDIKTPLIRSLDNP